MVHRIYVHAPTLPENNRKQSSSFLAQHQLLSIAVVVASAFAYSASSSLPLYHSIFIVLVVSGLFLSLKHLIGIIQTRNQFQKAAIEITSFGVQLVSIYGHNGGSHYDQTTLTNDSMLNDQPIAPATLNIDDNTHHVHNRSPHNTISKRQVRSFIPRERIIDVIVMEIVWPHCVWSQVAFRVDKGSESSLVHSKRCEGGNGVEHCSRRRLHEPASDDVDDEHITDIKQSNAKKYTDTDDQCTTAPLSIQALMKQNRVAIVPAFSEECRGLLSYKECLRLQEEIERLLGHSEEAR
eukprot:scaffold660_cov114-Skeletonema_marinoi.AAC.1